MSRKPQTCVLKRERRFDLQRAVELCQCLDVQCCKCSKIRAGDTRRGRKENMRKGGRDSNGRILGGRTQTIKTCFRASSNLLVTNAVFPLTVSALLYSTRFWEPVLCLGSVFTTKIVCPESHTKLLSCDAIYTHAYTHTLSQPIL